MGTKISLIVGGTSGLGLALAKSLDQKGQPVVIAGRHNPAIANIPFSKIDLFESNLASHITELIDSIPEVGSLYYAAGYYQEGTVTDLSKQQIEEMIDVGGRGLIYFTKELLSKQDHLDELITISSSSQWTPRKLEPIYNFVKAGAAHFSNSMSEDGRVDKVLVVGPSGMRTPFWEGIARDDIAKMLDPVWVADRVLELKDSDYKYRFAKILRDPPKVEIIETR